MTWWRASERASQKNATRSQLVWLCGVRIWGGTHTHTNTNSKWFIIAAAVAVAASTFHSFFLVFFFLFSFSILLTTQNSPVHAFLTIYVLYFPFFNFLSSNAPARFQYCRLCMTRGDRIGTERNRGKASAKRLRWWRRKYRIIGFFVVIFRFFFVHFASCSFFSFFSLVRCVHRNAIQTIIRNDEFSNGTTYSNEMNRANKKLTNAHSHKCPQEFHNASRLIDAL